MEIELKLELSNVYGGDGITRIEQVKETKLKRSTTRSRTKADIGITVDSKTGDTRTETVDREVNTFAQDNGTPTLRLGGIHGKIWGTMREAGEVLAELGKTFKSKTAARNMMKMVNIYPIDVPLENAKKMEVQKSPQITGGMNKAMIPGGLLFDSIPKCNATVTIEFPDEIKKQMLVLLERIQKMACLNRRRGSIKILNWDKIAG